jgi:D-3-phosphoglycerate dehydrogenase
MTPPLRILVSTSSFGKGDPRPLALLEAGGAEIVLNPHGRTLTETEAAALLVGIDGLIAGTEPLTRAVIDGAERLRGIVRVGVGMENVDLEAAERRGIPVLATPDAVTDSVAELTVGGLLATLRHIHLMDAELRAGRWTKIMGGLLGGRTVGIVGLGRVGRRVAELLGPFGVRLVATDLAPDAGWAQRHGVALLDMPTLLAEADVVTLHVSGRSEVLGAAELAALRPGAVIVNTSRGSVIDEGALVAGLESGAIAGAYLDVFGVEPYSGPLAALPGVLITPHVGSYAREARARMELEAATLLLEALRVRGA